MAARARLFVALVVLASSVRFAPAQAQTETLDRRLILRSRTEAADLWRQGWTLPDTALDARLQRLVDRATADRARDTSIVLRVHVFRSPVVNAFCLPDGSIYVFAGVLGRMNNWDEVTFVLAHEAEHALAWHGQKNAAQAKAKSTFFGILSLATGSNGIASLLGQLGLALTQAAMINGYGRELESDADAAAAAELERLGISPCAGAGCLRVMLSDQEKTSGVANFFWGDHPKLTQRMSAIGARTPGGCPADSQAVSDDYAALRDSMARFCVRMWLDDANLPEAFKQVRRCMERDSTSAEMQALLGETYTRAGLAKTADTLGRADTLALGERGLRLALELNASAHAPWRWLGSIAEARGDTLAAVDCLQRYLGNGDDVPNRRATQRKLDELRAAHGPGRETRAPADSTEVPPVAPPSPGH